MISQNDLQAFLLRMNKIVEGAVCGITEVYAQHYIFLSLASVGLKPTCSPLPGDVLDQLAKKPDGQKGCELRVPLSTANQLDI